MIQLLVPILFIISGIISLISAMSASSEEKMNKAIKGLIKKGIAIVMIFMIPTIVSACINIVSSSSNHEFSFDSCIINAKDKDFMAKLETENSKVTAIEDEKTTKVIDISGGGEEYSQKQTSLSNTPSSLTYMNQGWYSSLSFCKTSSLASSGCGPVSLSMIVKGYSKKYNQASNDIIVQEVRNWLCDMRGWNSDGGIHSSYMYHEKTLEHFGLNAEVLFKNQEIGFWSNTLQPNESNAIFKAVKKEGKSVILGIPGHWCVIGPNSSCKDDEVYMYDPSSAPKTTCYTMQNLYKVTYDHKNECSRNGMCGWAIAIAFWGK